MPLSFFSVGVSLQDKVPSFVSSVFKGTDYKIDDIVPIAQYRSLLIANDQSPVEFADNRSLSALRDRAMQIGAAAGYVAKFPRFVSDFELDARRQLLNAVCCVGVCL